MLQNKNTAVLNSCFFVCFFSFLITEINSTSPHFRHVQWSHAFVQTITNTHFHSPARIQLLIYTIRVYLQSLPARQCTL